MPTCELTTLFSSVLVVLTVKNSEANDLPDNPKLGAR